MKKSVSILTLAATLLLTSCFGTTAPTTGSTTNSGTGSTTAGIAQSLAGGLLSELLGATIKLSPEAIAGTWKYNAPDCVFESENLLMKAGGEVAAAQIESKIAPYLELVGLKKGTASITFNTDGTYTLALGSRSIPGNYTLDATNKTITMTFMMGLTQSTAKIAYTGNKLSLLYEADKILTLVKGLGALSGNSTVSTLSQLLESYDGLLIGLEMTK